MINEVLAVAGVCLFLFRLTKIWSPLREVNEDELIDGRRRRGYDTEGLL